MEEILCNLYFKKGNKLQPCNYRPVSLTSVLSKVMENFTHDHIMSFVSEHGLISIAQHGFVQRKSCVTNLLEARDILTEAVHAEFAADIIYTDFAKAFGKVPHKRLLHKLKTYGISNLLIGLSLNLFFSVLLALVVKLN